MVVRDRRAGSRRVFAPRPELRDPSPPRGKRDRDARRRATASGARGAAFTFAVRGTRAFFAHFLPERAPTTARLFAPTISRRARRRAPATAVRRRRRRRVEAPRAASAAAGCVQTTARRRDARTTVAGRRTRRPRAERATRRTPTRDAALGSASDSSKIPLRANGLLVLAKVGVLRKRRGGARDAARGPVRQRSVATDAFVPSSPVITRDEAPSGHSTSSRTCATW